MTQHQHRLHSGAARSALRDRLTDIIEQAITMLDALDGDPELEIETDLDLNPISLQCVDRVPAKRIRRAA